MPKDTVQTHSHLARLAALHNGNDARARSLETVKTGSYLNTQHAQEFDIKEYKRAQENFLRQKQSPEASLNSSAAQTIKTPEASLNSSAAQAIKTPEALEGHLEQRVLEAERCELLPSVNSRRILNSTFSRAIGVYLLIVALCSIYIFVRELLYTSSKEYAQLEGKKEVLIEENKELERKIEALQFKNKITNYFEVKYE